MKIALALSGGGFRATGFHLGVLARLAKAGRLEEVNFLSSVSGGSLCVALVYTLNGFRWPGSAAYLEKILPEARRRMITSDLQSALIRRVLGTFWTLFETRADDLSALLREQWGVTARLSDLPLEPRWMINATCYETGKNWRFESFRMGDYRFGYSYDTALPLSDAVAASAGFPGLVGGLVFDTTRRSWFQYGEVGRLDQAALPERQMLTAPAAQKQWQTRPVSPLFPKLHLWDGGVYDNHGLEGLVDFNRGWRDDIDFLVVSDAAGRSKPARFQWGPSALMRLATGVMMDQVRSLRTRAVLERIINHRDPGSFLQIGNHCRQILKNAGREAEIEALCGGCQDESEASQAAEMDTVIRKLTPAEFERLFRNGFEVADTTLYAYYPELFPYVGYGSIDWGEG